MTDLSEKQFKNFILTLYGFVFFYNLVLIYSEKNNKIENINKSQDLYKREFINNNNEQLIEDID